MDCGTRKEVTVDYNAIIQAIGSVGFPIVASVGMFYLYNKTVTELTNTLTRMDKTLELLREEVMNRGKGAEA